MPFSSSACIPRNSTRSISYVRARRATSQKAQGGDELLAAIQTVASGRRYLSRTLAIILAQAAAGTPQGSQHAALSKREFEVFMQLAVGHSVTDVAAVMGLSVKTVSTYRTRIFEKMNFSRNADITAYAMRHNMLAH